ncbi:MAG: hypothetical protein ACLP8S_04840 [Solirubrobacteraceae bacterium]
MAINTEMADTANSGPSMKKMITESGLELADRSVHTQYGFLRKVIHSVGRSLSSRSGANLSAAK